MVCTTLYLPVMLETLRAPLCQLWVQTSLRPSLPALYVSTEAAAFRSLRLACLRPTGWRFHARSCSKTEGRRRQLESLPLGIRNAAISCQRRFAWALFRSNACPID